VPEQLMILHNNLSTQAAPEPCRTTHGIKKFLASLQGRKIISQRTLSLLVTREGLPCHLDPFGTGKRVFLESEVLAWWQQKLQVSPHPLDIPDSSHDRRPL